jgi:hypothetical protein
MPKRICAVLLGFGIGVLSLEISRLCATEQLIGAAPTLASLPGASDVPNRVVNPYNRMDVLIVIVV